LVTNTTGSYNTAVGTNALSTNSGSNNNTAVGYVALQVCNAASNTACGYKALQDCSTGSENVAVGTGAAKDITTGGNNTAVGKDALNLATTADYNTVLGHGAGLNISTGQNNVCLGYRAGTSNSPSGQLTTDNYYFVLGDDNINNLYCADTSISSSDARDKTDVERFTHGLSWINKLSPVTYRWDKRSWYVDDPNTSINEGVPDGSKKRPRLHIGFLAQEHLEVEKEHGFGTERDNMIITDLTQDGDRYGMKYERLVPVLVNAVKELSAQNEALVARITALESN